MKTPKPLWCLSVLTTAEAEDAVSELLATVTGTAVAAYYDLDSRTSRVSAFLDQGTFATATARAAITAGLQHIQECGLDTGAAKIAITRVKREDWAESWKRHFQPMEIKVRTGAPGTRARAVAGARSLLVKPSWSKKKPAKNQAVVILDPGLSFGTGQHPTTSFCLHEIARCLKPGTPQSFLDIGTGSGILAIAAAKLGYTPVEAFDFDPDSVRVAGENARKNRIQHRLQLRPGDITKLPLRPAHQYDLICANLISTLLIAERRRIVNRLKPGGTLVLAGILAAEFTQVERAFAELKLHLHSNRTENEWCSGAFCFV